MSKKQSNISRRLKEYNFIKKIPQRFKTIFLRIINKAC